MKFVEAQEHDSLSAVYLCFVAAQLDQSLVEHGVTDEAVRRDVIGSFLFSHGRFIDSEWFRHENNAYKPSVFFAEVDTQRLPTDMQSGDYYSALTRGIVPPNDFGTCFHEYAFGTVEWLFEHMTKPESEQAEVLFTGTMYSLPED